MPDQMPLYAQVRRSLIERLIARDWRPGDALPAEMALAKEMGVSHGTLRKAIDGLCAEGALVRKHGLGTFVAEQTPETANFRFVRLFDGQGTRLVPVLQRQISAEENADAATIDRLGLADGARVIRLDRVRTLAGHPAMAERIAVPTDLVPDFGRGGPPPNALYPCYQSKYGIHIIRTEESITAVAADERVARMLGISQGAALLRAERVAFDLGGRAVEHRVTHILTQGCSFRVELL